MMTTHHTWDNLSRDGRLYLAPLDEAVTLMWEPRDDGVPGFAIRFGPDELGILRRLVHVLEELTDAHHLAGAMSEDEPTRTPAQIRSALGSLAATIDLAAQSTEPPLGGQR